ncbi:carboxymuconolactone decarboxylase family protein [Paraburkholderia hospita]|uniref:Alkylhydroperoxidase n=1 Tax=Paraburkholderia hospita TaxID=169430 RepID=A0AAN1JN01_9BURK|nr:carboxymuconolactone decarboxylase family protein [Paraburkholderia hospita]AUT76009.1 alkylhydroperoxidase [Paraburkholderia hospita]OUL96007.1 alkylhydroperoxidase [Paraburkholderia hospita]
MARIAIPRRDETPLASKPILDAFNRQFGFTPNQFSIMSLSPTALAGWTGLQGALSKTLDSKTRDGIALVVSQVNSCRYCLSAYTFWAANTASLSLEEISLNRMGTSSDSKRDAAVRFAKKLLETRGKVTESDLDIVRQAGFTDANLVEIIALSVQFLFTNFINNVFDTPIDFPVVILDSKTA